MAQQRQTDKGGSFTKASQFRPTAEERRAARVAAVAGTDPNIQAAVVNHNGQAQPSILDRIVPQLAPPAPVPG